MNNACVLCGNTDFQLTFHGNLGNNSEQRFSQYAFYDDIVRCQRCGLVFEVQRHSQSAIGQLLKAERYLDEEIGCLNVAEKHWQFEEILQIMREFHEIAASDKILDAGANTGVFLNYVKRYSEHVWGIEPAKEAVDAAKENFGLEIQAALIAEAQLEDSFFDVITMFDVIEHLTDPLADVRALFSKVKPGGWLFITTHDVSTKFARLMGRNYPMFMYQHFFHFSPVTLGRLVKKAGFSLQGVRYFEKSWSMEYLNHLIGKLWPSNFLGRAFQKVFSAVLICESLKRRRVTVPLKEFFLLAAQKPR